MRPYISWKQFCSVKLTVNVKKYCENIKDKKTQLNVTCGYNVCHCLVNMDYCIYIHYLEGRYI